jgi:hypothetical protein
MEGKADRDCKQTKVRSPQHCSSSSSTSVQPTVQHAVLYKRKGLAATKRAQNDSAAVAPEAVEDSSSPLHAIWAIRPHTDKQQQHVPGHVIEPCTIAAPVIMRHYAADPLFLCPLPQMIMFNNPALLHALLEHLTTALITYVGYQIEAGAQVVQLFDSWAHHLSPEQFAEFSLPYANRITEAVRAKYPHAPIIFHANGGAPPVSFACCCGNQNCTHVRCVCVDLCVIH